MEEIIDKYISRLEESTLYYIATDEAIEILEDLKFELLNTKYLLK